MKKFMLLFIIGQLFVYSFIFSKSFYDVYILNNITNSNLNAYYIDDVTGNNLERIYNCLVEYNAEIEIVKEPVSNNSIQEYRVLYSNNLKISKKVPINKDKKITYAELSKDDFVDSIGVFYTELNHNDMNKISEELELEIKAYGENPIDYIQILKNNGVNFTILLVITQVILFIYTCTRIKINAIKKLNGFSAFRMVKDSLYEFLKLEILSVVVILLLNVTYICVIKRFSFNYLVLLLFFIAIVVLITVIQLMLTQISIRFIDISDMIKNKTFRPVWSLVMNFTKIILLVAITLSITSLSIQLDNYNETLNNINKYRQLNTYFTSNGYNAQEYDKCFSKKEEINKISDDMKKMYEENEELALLIDANITTYSTDAYYNLYNISFNDLLNSYQDNYVVVNNKYYKTFMQLKDENGVCIDELPDKTILIPKKYKNDYEVIDYCKKKYSELYNYDVYYKNESEVEISDINIIFIDNNQNIPILDEYIMESNQKITNSIIYVDDCNLAGTWYLEELAKGKLSFKLPDRSEYQKMLVKYSLNEMLSSATLLTPLSDNIRYYEFIVDQAIVFVILFIATLILIVYFSCYLEIMINRKKYAIKYLMGFSNFRILQSQLFYDLLLLIITFFLLALKQNISAMIIGIVADLIFIIMIFNKEIIKSISGIMKGE